MKNILQQGHRDKKENTNTFQCVLVTQSCPTLCNLMDCSPPGFSVLGILQARIPEWVAISFSRGSLWPRDQTWVSGIAGKYFTIWATREASIFPRESEKSTLNQGLEYHGLFHSKTGRGMAMEKCLQNSERTQTSTCNL